MQIKPWGTHQGHLIFQYCLSAGDYKAVISNYGALLVHFYVPHQPYSHMFDQNLPSTPNIASNPNHQTDIVLGFDDLESYLNNASFFGASIGRFGNRIKDATFMLDHQKYHLTQNNQNNHLHGGLNGFDKKIWQATPLSVDNGEAIELCYISDDGEEGYPGQLTTTITYKLLSDGRLIYDVKATSDKDTICSIVNHSYFNLAGCGNILNHSLQIDANDYTEVDDQLIPTGRLLSVQDTSLDFRIPRRLKEAMSTMPDQSYDHNLVLSDSKPTLKKVARLSETQLGRALDVSTTLPGLQIYNSAGMAKQNIIGKQNIKYDNFAGLCLETQFFPNSPNEPNFPSPFLKAGDLWHHITTYEYKTL